MPSRVLPNLGLRGFYDVGENGWGAELSAGLLKLSVLVQGGIKSRVAAVPNAPVDGDVHVLTAAPNAQAVAVYDDGAWVYYPPSEGWFLYDRATDDYISFDGAAWVVFEGGGGDGDGGGIPEAPEDGKLYGRQDAEWAEITGGGGGGGGGGSAVVSARFWRVMTEARSPANVSAIGELTWLKDGEDITVGGTAISSGYLNNDATWSHANAFNKALPENQGWYAKSDGFAVGEWIGYDFGVPVAPTSWKVAAIPNYRDRMPRGWSMQYSDDGIVWKHHSAYENLVELAAQEYREWTMPEIAVGGGGGGGSGSPVSTRPTVVQMVKGRTNNASGDLTFPYELTPGNMVVVLFAGAASPGHLVPAGFQTIGYSSNDGAIEGHYRPGVGNFYQAGYAAIRRVIPGDPRNIFVQAGGDMNNWLLLEISDADMVDFQAIRMQRDDNTHFRTTRMRLPFDSLDLFFLEHDDVGALVPDAGTVLESYSGGGNHAGVVVDASDVDGDLTGTVASGALKFPVAYRLSVAKYQGAATRGGGGGGGSAGGFNEVDNPIDVRPLVTGAFNDEFDGTVLDPSWLWINKSSGGVTAYADVKNGAVQIATDLPQGGQQNRMLYKPVPVGDFDIICKIRIDGLNVDYHGLGLCAFNTASGRFLTNKLHFRGAGRPFIGWSRWNNIASSGAEGNVELPDSVGYVRMRREGTLLVLLYSQYGNRFIELHRENMADWVGDFDTIALCYDVENGGMGSHLGMCEWIRDYLGVPEDQIARHVL